MSWNENLKQQIERQSKRLKKADKEKPTLLAHTVFAGTIGLLLVGPVIAGAYIGRWLDEMPDSWPVNWTVSLIVLGVFIGAANVYLYIRE